MTKTSLAVHAGVDRGNNIKFHAVVFDIVKESLNKKWCSPEPISWSETHKMPPPKKQLTLKIYNHFRFNPVGATFPLYCQPLAIISTRLAYHDEISVEMKNWQTRTSIKFQRASCSLPHLDYCKKTRTSRHIIKTIVKIQERWRWCSCEKWIGWRWIV